MLIIETLEQAIQKASGVELKTEQVTVGSKTKRVIGVKAQIGSITYFAQMNSAKGVLVAVRRGIKDLRTHNFEIVFNQLCEVKG
ncbi:hypothetical protein GCE9029_01189 [Grimontia celer]|uniref:Uncharacterized protein n=1 Tax=Grimontia celer TaxID=1796497 RepID=A0A128EYC1_9GAMM|nr:hypothetical protein [Grimontia celer]CZF78996.1 hypothetical protein GCE9029_01189 [Grimontia celer]